MLERWREDETTCQDKRGGGGPRACTGCVFLCVCVWGGGGGLLSNKRPKQLASTHRHAARTSSLVSESRMTDAVSPTAEEPLPEV